MICCLNPHCQQPLNPDGEQTCRSCGASLVPLLRGHFRPVRPLGQGGFGRTYLALDEDRLKAPCVIKQFSPQMQGTKSLEKAIQLFNQEAVRLHELGEHPQIPTLLAYFEQDKYLYLVQQFIEGQTLFQELHRQGMFSEAKVRQVMADLLPVLKFIHDRQVIHRDITPANIIRRQVDGKLVLIDFGISKQLKDTTGMQPGTKIGTEGYAPIEQLRSGQAYPASDLYSLGATCVHLITGIKPEELYNPLDGRWIWRDYLGKRGIQVSDAIAQILEKMLRDLVSTRYQSAEEVFKDLNASAGTVKSLAKTPPKPATVPPGPVSKPPASRTSTSRPPAAKTPVAQTPISPMPVSKPPVSKPPASRTVTSGSGKRDWVCINTLTGHSSWVTSVAISPTGQILVSGSLDDTIKIWNYRTAELLQTLTGHSKAVNTLAISPTGQTLVSGSDDRTIRVWNLFNGNQLLNLSGHSRDVSSVAISADGQTLVSGSEDRTIKVWRLTSGALRGTLLSPAGMIKAVTVSPDGKLLISGGLDHQIKLWALDTGKIVRTLSGHFNAVNAVAISPDGKVVVSGSKDRMIKVWNPSTGELLRTLSDHSESVNSIVISADGNMLVSGSSDKTIKLWSMNSGELLFTLTGHLNPVSAVAISSDGQFVASGSWDNTIKVWQK
jgi:WD40 repeat protein/tRNA A-37 threonylcarbamoyl transferase component Bud32